MTQSDEDDIEFIDEIDDDEEYNREAKGFVSDWVLTGSLFSLGSLKRKKKKQEDKEDAAPAN